MSLPPMPPNQKQLLEAGLTFAYPVRPWVNAKIDTEFLDEHYRSELGTWHRGLDINGVGGGNTDLGWPVQSMFPGTVVDIDRKVGWGPVVLIRAEEWVRDFVAYRLGMELEVLDVQYAHLTNVSVSEGDVVNAGDHLGGIGTGDGRYMAHLHLEVRKTPHPAIVSQGSSDQAKRAVAASCIDPKMLLDFLPLHDYPNTLPQGRRMAPTRLVDYNGSYIEGDSVTLVNRLGDKLYIRDSHDGTIVPGGFVGALVGLFRKWFGPQH